MLLKSIIFSVCTIFGSTISPLQTRDTNAVKPEIVVIKDLNANTKSYIYFSLATGKEIPAADAKTKNWDIAFSKTTIATNGGNSGPGDGGAQVIEKPFDLITEAPKDGFKTDGDAGFAIPGGSGNSWYKYDMGVHAILPIPGRTILVKTANGNFAKLEVISYYKGAPEDVPTEESSYYTFRYAIAGDDGKF
ncbi:HmuY family protein [Dyadobacter sp. MSC1_007]|jgi:hypothetical protein|uniref:HmuY family protein n=1 Tax=Dyadobacter sp. MSC1_007 TaxID=2909264 RepID=UPI002030BD18|nr:HmuY family protein [Dyadobacter sp. MSC1_007]